MPFAFSQLQPLDTGRVSKIDVPLGQYLSNAFSQGVHDSMFASISAIRELEILERTGPLLSAEDATKQYGLGSLKFEQPVYESEARLLRQRKEAEMRRSFYLSSGNPDGLFSKRGIAGLGASMLGNILNPLDFAVNFVPVVGSEAAALRSASLGRGVARQALERGLVTTETLGRLPAPQLVTSLVNAGVGNVVAEVPHLVSALESKEDYTIADSITNVLAGTALGAAIHLGLSQAVRIYERLNPDTKETMLKEAINQYLEGKDIDVIKFVEIDEATLRSKVRFNEDLARTQATKSLSVEDVKQYVREKYKENVVSAAYKNPVTGEVRTGINHWLVPIDDWIAESGPQIRGFITDKGRFIEQAEAEAIGGISVSEQIADTSDPMFLLPEDREIFDHLKENGATDAEAMNEVRRILRERADTFFFSRPEIQEKLAQEKEKAVEKIIAEERAKYDEEGRYKIERDAEIQRQIKEGRILTLEQKKQWGFDKKTVEEGATELKTQIQELTQELEAELKAAPEGEKTDVFTKIDDALKKLKIEGTNKGTMEGVTGMPVWLWNGAIEAVRLALKAGKTLAEAIDEGVKHLRDGNPFKQMVDAIMKEHRSTEVVPKPWPSQLTIEKVLDAKLSQDEYFRIRAALFYLPEENYTKAGLLESLKEMTQSDLEEASGGMFVTDGKDSPFILNDKGELTKNPEFKLDLEDESLWEIIESSASVAKKIKAATSLEFKLTSSHDKEFRSAVKNALQPKKMSDRQLYNAAKAAGEVLYGKSGSGEKGTHGGNFSFQEDYEVRRLSKKEVEAQMAENESYELHTFDPYTEKPLWTNAEPIDESGLKFGEDPFVPAKDGRVYIADQNFDSGKTMIYVIETPEFKEMEAAKEAEKLLKKDVKSEKSALDQALDCLLKNPLI